MAITDQLMESYAKEYAELGAKAKQIEARMVELKAAIFKGLDERVGQGKASGRFGGYIIRRQASGGKPDRFNDERTVARLKELASQRPITRLLEPIQTVEVVDVPALERLVEDGILAPTDLAGCIDKGTPGWACKVEEAKGEADA